MEEKKVPPHPTFTPIPPSTHPIHPIPPLTHPIPPIPPTRENVFIFGSNLGGFHGAGSAGLAMRGEAKNTWRTDQRFLRAMKAPKGTKGDDDRKGLRAVYGVAEGLQRGTEGLGYGVPTVVRPGAKRSIPLEKIGESLKKLWLCAAEHPEYDFTYTPLGCGYAGYTPEEMLATVRAVMKEVPTPKNLGDVEAVYARKPTDDQT